MSPEETIQRMREARETLEAVVEDRLLLDLLEPDTKRALLIAAGRLSGPERSELRAVAKARKKAARRKARAEDEALLDATGIRTLRAAPVYETPAALPPPKLEEEPRRPALNEPRKCYICKGWFDTVHPFYDQMCGPCADLNLARREQTADLSGRVALITGARVKIGYHAGIKLLRAGAEVIVTTRFPHDAARRYAAEADASEWQSRLSIYGLDLRHTPSIERFCAHLNETLPQLDFIINNACQTVRRPAGFYQHLMDGEALGELPTSTRPLLEGYYALRGAGRLGDSGSTLPAPVAPPGTPDSAKLSQAVLLPEDRGRDLQLFPKGELDADGQQVDLRDRNSWRLTLDEVPTVELLEVQLVNAVAPYVLNGRLRGLMNRTATRDKHIVNVSAMEGQFYRRFKTDKHPHTNMAKAALNMMTRTSATDYIADGIHMNSVDTGWITDEDAEALAVKKTAVHGFHPPLDIVDGAARIIDPIFRGFITGEHDFGLFLKDYRAVHW